MVVGMRSLLFHYSVPDSPDMVSELHPFFPQRRRVMLVATLRVGCNLLAVSLRGICLVLAVPLVIMGRPCNPLA